MPRVKFSGTAYVLDRRYNRNEEADLDDAVAAEVVKSGVGSIVAGAEVRTAVSQAPDSARKAVKLGG